MSKIYRKQGVRYWFDTFSHLNSFDIIPYQEVIDLYLKNHELLGNTLEKEGGENERPLNSDEESIDFNAFWLGHSPSYYDVDPFKQKTLKAKADIISMDMTGVNKTWDHWMYLVLPGELFVHLMTSVHSNPDVRKFKEFIKELDSGTNKKITNQRLEILTTKYNTKYPELHKFKDFFEEHEILQWNADLNPTQFITLKEKGLIYPICYVQTERLLNRGTHRALLLAMSGSDVPIFIQYPKLGKEPVGEKLVLYLQSHFENQHLRMEVDIESKELTFFRDMELIGKYN